MKLSLWPLRGFMNSARRQEVPLNALTGPSRDWLVGRGRYRRRNGSSTVTNGLLESKWGALARRMYASVLDAVTDGFPTPLVLFVKETVKSATLCFRASGSGAWHTVGDGFSASTYPDAAVVSHRVVPMVYRNEYGGLTLHRLNTVEYREHMAAGSRGVLHMGRQVCWPGRDSAPTRWDGDDDPCTVFPMGLVPPLQMPVCTAGNNLTAAGIGPWKGSNAFFYSLLFENEEGELSMFTIPRAPNSAWSGYEGFGYMHVDATNPTHVYDKVTFSFIADGPPGTRWKWLLRSAKVDIATTGSGTGNMPSSDDLQLLVRLPQGVTSYEDTSGNDLALDPDPRIQEMFRRGGLQWPPCAQEIGQFDGRIALGNLRPNPYALIIAPWASGAVNAPIDNAGLYGTTSYFAAVTPTTLYLRSVVGGAATDTTYTLTGLTLRKLVDAINADASLSTVTLANCSTQYPGGPTYIPSYFIFRASALTGVAVGDTIVSARYPAGTKVTSLFTVGAYYGARCSNVALSDAAALASPGGEDFSFTRRSGAITRKWAAAVVPGADADESTDSLLRTYVGASCRFSIAAGKTVTTADAPYITPGMTVKSGSGGVNPWPAGTIVTAVGATTITVSNVPTRNDAGALETVDIGYDTGDTTLGLLPGFVRTFGNAFPAVLPWNTAYLAKFKDSLQDTIFSAASPGYAQNGINTWLQRNRQGGPAMLGAFVGAADLGPVAIQFYTKGRVRLWNPRTGTTHSDTDYTKSVVSWSRGCRSPYTICQGTGWAFFVADEGGFFCTAGDGEALVTEALFKAENPVGERGELEYAIAASIAASDAGTDAFAIHASVEGGVLSLRYWSSEAAGYPDREVRYDFSDGAGRTGLAEVLRPDGTPYPWSAPLTLRHSCSARMTQADGLVHTFAAVDSNGHASKDGKVLEIDTGLTDDGTLVVPVGYTGIALPPDLEEIQPTMAYVVSTKAGSGLTVSLTQEPEMDPEDAPWDVLDVQTSGADAFGRSVVWLPAEASLKRQAIAAKIWDDGTGPCPEVTMVQIDCNAVKSTTGKRSRP